jgi:ParB family transcriptional regulator, chromosome partitioning protein
MAAVKQRLGRGLSALISGSADLSHMTTAKKVMPSTPAVPLKKKVGSSKFVQSKPLKSLPSKVISTKVAPKKAVASKPTPFKEAPEKSMNPALSTPVVSVSEPLLDKHNLYLEIPLSKVQPNPHQPRRHMRDEALQELAESIRSEGLLQPIVVRRVDGDVFELIAGERRLRACKKIGLSTIPARVLEVSDASSAVLALIENLQREGLDPIEEALGYSSLMSDFRLTQESVAERVGKSRPSIANALRLLQLDKEIQAYIGQGLLSSGHAKVLLGIEDAAYRLIVARKVIEQGLSVREAEQEVRRIKLIADATNAGSMGKIPSSNATIELHSIEKRLSSHLNTKVHIKHSPKKGRVLIEYYGERDLERLLERLGV